MEASYFVINGQEYEVYKHPQKQWCVGKWIPGEGQHGHEGFKRRAEAIEWILKDVSEEWG